MAEVGGSGAKFTNRLAKETSPYLLQHAHNPVDWHAWGEEAFTRAREENKPIFLSVGYSTCYWCHVMERQSFENEQVAGEMNRLFVNIKVDREERPDVDQLYMQAVQVLTHHGGWPMSVFLRPDLKPFYGGTYFPPTDMGGRPGFLTIMRAIEDAYRNRPGDVEKTSAQLMDILRQLAEPGGVREEMRVDGGWVEELVKRSTADYEGEFGGFGRAPKFPRETLLEMLLVYSGGRTAGGDTGGTGGETSNVQRSTSNIEGPTSNSQRPTWNIEHRTSNVEHRTSSVRRMVCHALNAMANGGIRDQLGGGFHRYSTDARWLVPHFEIMLYDNAMLGWVYAEAFRQTGEGRYAQVARGIFDFVLREMTSPEGAFYTAFDAEVDAMEGQSYLWTAGEIEEVLGKEDAKVFNRAYGVDRGPNFEDPHHGNGRPEKNILYLPDGISEKREKELAPLREKLYEARKKRKQPLLDTKIITSWNGLMIRAMAYAGKVLGEERYTRAARRAADFLLRRHTTGDGGLWRTSREGVMRHAGFLDDYAFLAQALLELGRDHEAARTAEEMEKRFLDPDRGGFYFTRAGADDLIVRQKVASDSPLPSGNAVAAMVEIRLGKMDMARKVIEVFARQIEDQGEGMSSMVQAVILYLERAEGFVVKPSLEETLRPASSQEVAEEVVGLAAAWESPSELHIRVEIKKGYHINAHQAGKGLAATALTVSGAEVAGIDYRPGEKSEFAFAEGKLPVYSDETLIVVRFKEAMTGRGVIEMGLAYQACSDEACLPTVTKQFEVQTP